jgi:ATP-dependent protease ClpP protease subunit
MEGNIYITGLIGSMPMEIGVELIDVIQQVKKQPEATSFNVHINSEGGVVDTGFDIYNYLKSLNLPITTIGSGLVASIATVIFMAGNSRILRDNTQFMIHLPMGEVGGTADEIENYVTSVRQAEKRLIDFYKKEINTTEEAIRPLLVNETWLTNEQALSLGFSTQANLPMVAKAYFNTNTNNNKMTKEDKGFFTELINKILNKGQKIVNLDLTDANGVIVNFPDLMEGDIPKLGDSATVDGKPAEGDYLIDGITHVFVGGKITDIIEPMEDDADMQALKAENESLKEQLATSISNYDTIVNDVVSLKKQITSRFEFDGTKEAAKEKEEQTTKRQLLK